MTRLRPLRPTTTQVTRLFKEPVGSGFPAYRCDQTHITVVEFLVAPDGTLTKPDGTRLTYTLDDGKTVLEYELRKIGQAYIHP